jgi:hypothetical protein
MMDRILFVAEGRDGSGPVLSADAARSLLKSHRRVVDNKMLGSVPYGCPSILRCRGLYPAVAVVLPHQTPPGFYGSGPERSGSERGRRHSPAAARSMQDVD